MNPGTGFFTLRLKFSVAQIETRKMNEREVGKYPIKEKVHIGVILRRERPIRFFRPKNNKVDGISLTTFSMFFEGNG